MRDDPESFRTWSQARTKEPRFVVNIVFPLNSLYITSHADITGVPGVVLNGCLAEPNLVSQKLNPDEGRAEIGTASFRLVDIASQFTTQIKNQLAGGNGLRRRQVRFYLGKAGDAFSAFQLIGTQEVQDADYDKGAYTVSCADVQRGARKEIFAPVATTLAASVLIGDTTILVEDTGDFARVAHGSSYSDAPSSTVGYIRIKDEVIRYTGKTATSFTGCTRGVLGTTAAAYPVDAGTPASRREKVTEEIYLELPGPKLLYAILTGQIYGTANVLPAHWHCGIATSLIRASDFTGIGPDLWETTDDTKGVVLRFVRLSKIDAKKFYETEILRLLGLFAPVYADGTLGLRRMTRVLSDAATVATLDESNTVSVGALQHDMQALRNSFTVEWNPAADGKSFTRSLTVLDATSRTVHGEGEELKLQFRGLWGGRHTDSTVYRLVDALRDRYAAPPERLSVDALHLLNHLEPGDVVRAKYAHVRDYAGAVSGIDRAFEVQGASVNHRTGKVSLNLFGSTAPASTLSPTQPVIALPDAFYSSAGTPLSSVTTITGGVMATGSYVLAGTADMNAAGSIWYHLGDLTIPNGCTLTISGNVQLRVMGELTLNGSIVGIGGGKLGVADVAGPTQPTGNSGLVGNSRGWDGIAVSRDYENGPPDMETVPAQGTRGVYPTFPPLVLEVVGSALRGIPTDLRGTGGPPGGRVTAGGVLKSLGGAGANGGAGLAIVSRGFGLGASASINLSGNSSIATTVLTPDRNTYAAGPGGAGGPGAMLVLLDGSLRSVPDFTGKFTANTGAVTLPSGALPPTGEIQYLDNEGRHRYPSSTGVWLGYPSPDVVSSRSLSIAALRIQYVPAPETATEDVASKPPAPTSLTAVGDQERITYSLGQTYFGQFDLTEIWTATANDRTTATGPIAVYGNQAIVFVPGGGTRYAWARNVRLDESGPVYSDWMPTSSTGGVVATALPAPTIGGTTLALGVGIVQSGSTLTKVSGGGSWNAHAYSRVGYYSGAYASAQGAQTNAAVMFALNSDPTTDADYTSLDFAWYLTATGTLEIYENGVSRGTFGTYTTATVPAIGWDGGTVRYFKDGVVVREVPYAVGPLYFDSSFGADGVALNNVTFVPVGIVPGGTVQGAALNRDPNFRDASAWESFSSPPARLPANRFVTVTDGRVGPTAYSNQGNYDWINGADRIPLDPAKTYRFRGRIRRTAGSGRTAYLGVALFDSAGANISGDGTQWFYVASAITPASDWITYTALFGASTSKPFPSNARTMTPLAVLSYDTAGATDQLQDVRIEEALPTSLLAPDSVSTLNIQEATGQAESWDGVGYNLPGTGDYEITLSAEIVVNTYVSPFQVTGSAGFSGSGLTTYGTLVPQITISAAGTYYLTNIAHIVIAGAGPWQVDPSVAQNGFVAGNRVTLNSIMFKVVRRLR